MDSNRYVGRGGKREGAGRHYAFPKKCIKVPDCGMDNLAKRLDELDDLLTFYEADCIANPSPRKQGIQRLIEEIRSLNHGT